MSLITQCPACSTMFRVVPDQLRISEGWVRCGQCDEVFDANAHLRMLDESTLSPPAAPAQVPMASVDEPLAPAPAEQPTQAAPAPSYDWGPMLDPVSEAHVDPEVATEGVLHAQDEPTPAPVVAPLEEPILHTADLNAAPASEDLAAPLDPFLAHSPHDAPLEQPLDHAALSFMAASQPAAPARRWLGNKVLVTVCVLLAMLVALQYLITDRDMVAASVPTLRPLLNSLCEPLNCRVEPPRQIDAIAIESSTFTSMKPGVYVLSLALKNSAAIELATPALELTLTDMQDQPLFRRVLLPAELGAVAQMAAGAELSVSTPIGVTTNAALEKIAGYKLLAFYP